MKKMFSKEEFVEILEALCKESDTLSELYQKYHIDIIDCEWHKSDYYLIEVLEYIFDDTETNWIDWWCWETDFGRDWDLSRLYYTENNEEVELIIDSAEKLYDFLVSNMKEKMTNG